jgi:hypothetical protein
MIMVEAAQEAVNAYGQVKISGRCLRKVHVYNVQFDGSGNLVDTSDSRARMTGSGHTVDVQGGVKVTRSGHTVDVQGPVKVTRSGHTVDVQGGAKVTGSGRLLRQQGYTADAKYADNRREAAYTYYSVQWTNVFITQGELLCASLTLHVLHDRLCKKRKINHIDSPCSA